MPVSTEQRSAHRIIADDFMAKKGLDITPYDSEPLEGDADCVYFYYRLPQGTLELEVFYDRARDDWDVAVTSFPAS